MKDKKNDYVRVGISALIFFLIFLLVKPMFINNNENKNNQNIDTTHNVIKNNDTQIVHSQFIDSTVIFDPILFINTKKISPESFHVIGELNKYLISHPQIKIKLIGYSDKSGNKNQNHILSENRAKIVRNELIKYDSSLINRIGIECCGKEKLNEENDNYGENKLLNRKVEIKLVK